MQSEMLSQQATTNAPSDPPTSSPPTSSPPTSSPPTSSPPTSSPPTSSPPTSSQPTWYDCVYDEQDPWFNDEERMLFEGNEWSALCVEESVFSDPLRLQTFLANGTA
jgi:hypothetical protein